MNWNTILWIAAEQQPQAGRAFSSMFMMLLVLFFLFYILILRPQRRQEQERRRLLQSLQKGDKVITVGGIHGTIVDLDDDSVTLEVAKNVRIDFTRSAVSQITKKRKEKGSEGKER